jgi:hypothetical protein
MTIRRAILSIMGSTLAFAVIVLVWLISKWGM